MKQKQSNLWRIIAKSLGEKSGKNDKEADQVALIRLIMFMSIFITNSFIVYGVTRTHHFPNYEIQRCVSETKEKGSVQ
jgi:hypothetical protein